MVIEELEKELKTGKLHSIYLLYGEEEYLLQTCVKKIKKIFGDIINGINFIQIDDKNVDRLISDIETPAFGYPKKLIIVKDSGLFKKESKSKQDKTNKNSTLQAKIAKYLIENKDIIDENLVLVFIEAEVAKNELQKSIEQLGIICNFEKLKPIQISKRIKAICSAYKVKIDDKTLGYFIETCGTNMMTLINEIRKLIEYVGENGTITQEYIDLLSIKELDSVIFDLTDNIGQKKVYESLTILNELLYNKEPIQKILITLYNHFKKLYLTKIAEEYGEDIKGALNLKPNQVFLITKYKRQSAYFKKDELKTILQRLIDLDYKSKRGLIDINIGLEAILCF